MNLKFLAISAAIALSPAVALAQQTPASAPPAAAGAYSTQTTPIGDLLDDPAAKAVLAQNVPDVVKNDQVDMARGMTLRDIQQYAPDVLTDAVLAKLDADLAKVPVKK
jgi:para-nitrobenzyl esterase